ncbi:MAG: 2-C-methyl-D-erythritol 4-phosphate cytidylyltransferase [Deltaproteobacteria bacterium]|nr:2-C-methyl-D-erythritol 4-phosphate cytidylyltransferase [Deltaproteobacteria bacterium]MDO8956612.1 2-C-methyl-D-erythritol 4-phosphate cytidylyltransferase [Deltaproteobacteria bacterium]MDO9210082.1 2-C-methyl-D-erythritol 4-phosphate cytidylyltransferase [Deltaproteobacteria bacterium]
MMRVVALIPAAGRGRRMGKEIPKASLSLGGIPLLWHTLQKFEGCTQVDEILPLVPPKEVSFWTDEIGRRSKLKKVQRVLAGGEERQDSVFLGLKAIAGNADWVIIHDGARPFVPPELIERALSETRRWKAVTAALPAGETIKEVSLEKEVLRTVDRGSLWIIQTPQSFEYSLILSAHEKAREERFCGTDDASLVERLGIPVRVIEGSRFNFKITTPEDLILGEALLQYLK